MKNLKVCFSMFLEESRRDEVAAELAQRYEESGKDLVQSQEENLYGKVIDGVLYVRRVFPVQEDGHNGVELKASV